MTMVYNSGLSTSSQGSKLAGVYLQVIIGKTVEAFRVNGVHYNSQGKAGAAILGNEEQCRYDLYIYREDQQKITSARITYRFKFQVHQHLYCTFFDNSSVPWSLRFDRESDMIEFIQEIAVARWKSSKDNYRSLVQDVLYGDPDRTVSPNDSVCVSYSISLLDATSCTRTEMTPGGVKQCMSPATSQVWEIPLVGCCLSSKRIVILPPGSSGQWEDILPSSDHHVWLEMSITDIKQADNGKNKFLPETVHTSVSQIRPVQDDEATVSRESLETKSLSGKDEISNRLMKMGGQALVPFPSYPSEPEGPMNDGLPSKEVAGMKPKKDFEISSSDELTIGDIQSKQKCHVEESVNIIKECMTSSSTASARPINPRIFSSRSASPQMHPSPKCFPDFSSYSNLHPSPIQAEDVHRVPSLRDPEFNMMFSEVRTTNSEIRMSLMRLTDKIDSLASKNDVSGYDLKHSLEQSLSSVSQWLAMNNNLKDICEKRFDSISDHNRAVLDLLIQQQKAKSEVVQKMDSMHDDIIQTLLSLQPKSTTELQISVSDSDGLVTKLSEAAPPSSTSGMASDNNNKRICKIGGCVHFEKLSEALEQVKSLEEINLHLEGNKIDSDYKLVQAEERLAVLKKEIESLSKLKHSNRVLEESIESLTLLLKSSEDNAAILKEELMRKESELQGQISSNQLAIAVKNIMNQSYRALKPILPTERLQMEVADALRTVTNQFLEKCFGLATSSSDEGIVKSNATGGGNANSCNGRFSPSSSLPPIIKPRTLVNDCPTRESAEGSSPAPLSVPHPVDSKSCSELSEEFTLPPILKPMPRSLPPLSEAVDSDLSGNTCSSQNVSDEIASNQLVSASSPIPVQRDLTDYFKTIAEFSPVQCHSDNHKVDKALDTSNESVNDVYNSSPIEPVITMASNSKGNESLNDKDGCESIDSNTYTIDASDNNNASLNSEDCLEIAISDNDVDDVDFSLEPVTSSPYPPFVTEEPPPLPPAECSASPSPPPATSVKQSSKSDSLGLSRDEYDGDKIWTERPPPLNLHSDDEDEDAWLFN